MHRLPRYLRPAQPSVARCQLPAGVALPAAVGGPTCRHHHVDALLRHRLHSLVQLQLHLACRGGGRGAAHRAADAGHGLPGGPGTAAGSPAARTAWPGGGGSRAAARRPRPAAQPCTCHACHHPSSSQGCSAGPPKAALASKGHADNGGTLRIGLEPVQGQQHVRHCSRWQPPRAGGVVASPQLAAREGTPPPPPFPQQQGDTLRGQEQRHQRRRRMAPAFGSGSAHTPVRTLNPHRACRRLGRPQLAPAEAGPAPPPPPAPLPLQSRMRTACSVAALATPNCRPPTTAATWVPCPSQSRPA